MADNKPITNLGDKDMNKPSVSVSVVSVVFKGVPNFVSSI